MFMQSLPADLSIYDVASDLAELHLNDVGMVVCSIRDPFTAAQHEVDLILWFSGRMASNVDR